MALIALFYAAFKTYSMWVHDGDEHIYFAMAQAVVHGKVPYWDFFFAHPPVHLVVPALLFAVFGFSYGLALWIAPLACLAAGLALWRLVRRFAPGWVAVLTMILFLFGRTVLQSSSHLTGVNIGLMFLCWGAERLAADKPKTGGVLLALSVLTGIYFLPASVGVLALYAFYRPRRSLGALALFLLVTRRGRDLRAVRAGTEQVFFYQRAKGPDAQMSWAPTPTPSKAVSCSTTGRCSWAPSSEVWPVRRAAGRGRSPHRKAGRRGPAQLRRGRQEPGGRRRRRSGRRPEHGSRPPTRPLWRPSRPILGGFLTWAARTRRSLIAAGAPAPWAALGLAGALWVACHWILLATLPVVWRYYFAVVFVGASVATAVTVFAVWRGLRPALRSLWERRRITTWSPVAFAGAILLSFALGFGHDLTLGKKYDIWNLEEEVGKERTCDADSCRQGKRNKGYADGICMPDGRCEGTYEWRDSPARWVPGWFNSLVRSLSWGGSRPPDEARTWSLQNTLWHESRSAPVQERLLDAAWVIQQEACEGDTIFGDSGTAPMLANLTGLRIAGNVFDTNQQRFDTGFIDPKETARRITNDGVRFIILGGNRWAKEEEPIAELVEKDFRPLWPDPGEEPFGITVYVTKARGWCDAP